MKKKEKIAEEPMGTIHLWGDLKTISHKIRGIAYLLERQNFEGIPPDEDLLWWGIATILMELGDNVGVIAKEYEKLDLSG